MSASAEAEARAQLLALEDLMLQLKNANTPDERNDITINCYQNALSVEVRGYWYQADEQPENPVEYRILLCCGGPAVRITGSLQDLKPDSAVLEYQWAASWVQLNITNEQYEALLQFAQLFDYQ